jgi:hypothetical protein
MPFIVVLAGILSFAPPLDTLCSVSTLRSNPEGYVWPVSDVQSFARGAQLIVRVRADSLDDGFEDQHILAGGPPSSVHFTVLETIRGASPSRHLRIAGVFAEGDDFNPAPVPYQIVRPSG